MIMFNRIVNFFRDVRIKIDFSNYEKQCRLEHDRVAEATHSTHQLDSELGIKTSQIYEHADSLFRTKISHLSGEIIQLNIVIFQKLRIPAKPATNCSSNQLAFTIKNCR